MLMSATPVNLSWRLVSIHSWLLGWCRLFEAEYWWLARLTLVIRQMAIHGEHREYSAKQNQDLSTIWRIQIFDIRKMITWRHLAVLRKSFDLWRSQFCIQQVTCARYLGRVRYGAVCKTRADLWFYSLNLLCKINILSKHFAAGIATQRTLRGTNPEVIVTHSGCRFCRNFTRSFASIWYRHEAVCIRKRLE